MWVEVSRTWMAGVAMMMLVLTPVSGAIAGTGTAGTEAADAIAARVEASAGAALAVAEGAGPTTPVRDLFRSAVGLTAGLDEGRVRIAERTLDAVDHAPSAEDSAAFVAWALSLQNVPTPDRPLPDEPLFADLPSALHALYAHHGHEPDRDEHADIAAFAATPPTVADAIARIIGAHIAMDLAARDAFTRPMMFDGAMHAFDVPFLVSARDRLAATVLEAARDLAPVESGTSLLTCDVVVLDTSGGPNAYSCDSPLVIELGGNDFYSTNAGGNFMPFASALMVDLSGDDIYSCTRTEQGINGGGLLGAGHLFDLGGNDTYTPIMTRAGGLNGGALNGTSLQVDIGGDDTHYVVSQFNGATLGGATLGVGALIDTSGNDQFMNFASGDTAAIGGAIDGRGLVVDRAGDDFYQALIAGRGAGNGAALGGAGQLIDLAGRDDHETSTGGDGALLGAAFGGLGLLYDAEGGGQFRGSVGGVGAVNGAAVHGIGILASEGTGDNYYIATVGAGGATNGGAIGARDDGEATPEPPGALALFVAGGGVDLYDGNGVSIGAADLYATALAVDRGGVNTMIGTGPLSEGAGARGATGILVDHGEGTMAFYQGGGQGYGAAGTGILLRPQSTGFLAAWAPTGTSFAHGIGGGVGIWRDAGEVVLQGAWPDHSCPPGTTLHHQATATQEIAICNGSGDGATPLHTPHDGEAAPAVPKPSHDCTADPSDPVCVAATTVLGPHGDEWLESGQVDPTTAGGSSLLSLNVYNGASYLGVQETALSADGYCGDACFNL